MATSVVLLGGRLAAGVRGLGLVGWGRQRRGGSVGGGVLWARDLALLLLLGLRLPLLLRTVGSLQRLWSEGSFSRCLAESEGRSWGEWRCCVWRRSLGVSFTGNTRAFVGAH